MQRVVGLALVALQAALMGLLARTVLFPVLVVLTASIGAFTKWRVPLSREKAFLLSAGAAFFFLLKHRFSPHEFPIGAEFIRTHVAFMIAQFLLLIEAAQFIIRHEEDALSPALPALGAVALVCIADIQITEEQRNVTQAFAISYPLIWAVFLWVGRRPMPVPKAGDRDQEARRVRAIGRRRFAAAFVLFLAATTAWASSLGLYEVEKKIENWLISLMSGSRDSGVGFSRPSRLGSVAHKKSQAEQEIALWAYADKFPGYLRGAVFFRFDSDMWIAERRLQSLMPLKSSERPEGMRPLRKNEFLHSHPMLHEKSAGHWRYLECWLAEDQDSAAFTPLGTTHLISASDQVRVFPYGVFSLSEFEKSNPYTACIPEQFASARTIFADEVGWRHVPEEYQRAFYDLAGQVFVEAPTDQEKVQAVERYFQENYGYHLGIEIPPGEDPLLYFLREKPAAHCEYFATAAVLLLRAGGVPARYVTGFVPAEWNPSGNYWVARNRDAHAWAEAYVEPEGWVTVEATPTEGVPSTDQPPTRWAWWETLKSDWCRLRTFLAQNRWDGVRSVLTGTWLGGFVGLFSLAFVVYLAVRIPWRWPFRKRPVEWFDPDRAAMQGLLEEMDNQLRPHGLERFSGETLHQFARRIREWDHWRTPRGSAEEPPGLCFLDFAERSAEWYRHFADFRYQGKWDVKTLDELRSRLPLPETAAE